MVKEKAKFKIEKIVRPSAFGNKAEVEKIKEKKTTLSKEEKARKQKKAKAIDKILKKLSKPITSRQVLKKSNLVINIPESEPESILGEENKFFTGEFNKEKRSLFLS